ncbi:MAG: hypothetical protein EB023_05900 [Flavobacteriia bacterium]|nr:hypothetical protein [Flavobacteriia bacterium]
MCNFSNVLIACHDNKLSQSIYSSVNKVKDLLQLSEKYQFKINLQHNTDTLSWIARFNVDASSTYCFSITLNHAWMVGHKGDNTEIIKAILHETVHGLDYHVLSESIQDYVTNAHQTRLLLTTKGSNKFWLLAHYFFTLRNEGLALCAEQFLLAPSDFLMHEDLAKAAFNDGIQFLLTTSSEDEGPESLIRFFESIYAFAGPLMAKVYHFSGVDFGLKQLDLVVKKDLSEWVKDVLEAAHEEGINGFLGQFSRAIHVDFCVFKSINEILDAATTANLHGIEPLDKCDFTEFDKLPPCNLKDILYQNFLNLNELYGKDEILLQSFHGYLKKKKDLISDDLPFLGLLDDYVILEHIKNKLLALKDQMPES